MTVGELVFKFFALFDNKYHNINIINAIPSVKKIVNNEICWT